MPFELDTSGRVVTELSEAFETYYEWGDLAPFTQAYLKAALDGLAVAPQVRADGAWDWALTDMNEAEWWCDDKPSDAPPFKAPRFDMIAPETLGRVIDDCAWLLAAGWKNPQDAFDLRQKGVMPGQQALSIELDDDGKIVFA